MSLLTEEKLVEFLKSGKFCEIFGHQMETYGQSTRPDNLEIRINASTINLSSNNIESHTMKCNFCHRQTIWTKETKVWETQNEGGLENWDYP